MRIVGPVKFWKGCVIYLKNFYLNLFFLRERLRDFSQQKNKKLKKSQWRKQTHTHTHTDMATHRPTRPSGAELVKISSSLKEVFLITYIIYSGHLHGPQYIFAWYLQVHLHGVYN